MCEEVIPKDIIVNKHFPILSSSTSTKRDTNDYLSLSPSLAMEKNNNLLLFCRICVVINTPQKQQQRTWIVNRTNRQESFYFVNCSYLTLLYRCIVLVFDKINTITHLLPRNKQKKDRKSVTWVKFGVLLFHDRCDMTWGLHSAQNSIKFYNSIQVERQFGVSFKSSPPLLLAWLLACRILVGELHNKDIY